MGMLDGLFKSVLQKFLNNRSANFKSKFVIIRHLKSCIKTCILCKLHKDRIFESGTQPSMPLHPKCDCIVDSIETMEIGTISEKGLEGPDVYLKNYGKLPNYYITKKDAIQKYGWNSKRNTLAGKAPGKMIGGDIFYNIPAVLPVKEGRTWFECDVDYVTGGRNSKRLYYSSDGLMFYSPGHLSSYSNIDIEIYLVE